MSDWISVEDRLPIRDENNLIIKFKMDYKSCIEPEEMQEGKSSFISGFWTIEECFTACAITKCKVIAWKYPSAGDCAKYFKAGRYASFEDSPKMPTKTTYKYPNK